jgi:hypothetical protein
MGAETTSTIGARKSLLPIRKLRKAAKSALPRNIREKLIRIRTP